MQDIADALSAFSSAYSISGARAHRAAVESQLVALFVGVMSQRQGAARNAAWDEATTPLFQRTALQRFIRDARLFTSNHFPHIQRMARALASEKRLPVWQVAWMLDSAPQQRAA